MIYDEKYDIPIFEDEDILDAVDYSEKLKNALVTKFDKDNNTINIINGNIDGISNMVISIYRTKADANSVYTKKESDNKYANAIKQELTKAKEAQINSTGANLQNVQFFGESVQETEPSVDYPSPINSITNVDYKIIGKNMAPANVETKTISGVSVKNNNDGTYTLNGTTTGERSFGFYAKSEEQKVNLKEGKTYKLVVKEFSGSKTAGSVTSAVRKDTGELVYNYITQGSPVVTATYNSTVEFINLYVSGAGVVFDNYRLGIMLIEQGENEEFEAYKEKTTTITLPEGAELCSLPNGVEDCVDSTGVIHKKIGKMVLDGTGNYGSFSGYTGEGYCYYFEDSRFKVPAVNADNELYYKNSLCTHFTNVYAVWHLNNGKIGKYSDHITLPRKYFISDKPTLEEFKAQLAELQPVLIYELAEETRQNLEDKEKEKLKNIETFEGINNIISNTPISAVYNTDTKSYIDSKFNTLAQQILNIAGGN